MWHVKLREFGADDAMHQEIAAVRDRINKFSASVRDGLVTGFTG